jgi:hypothetical protein
MKLHTRRSRAATVVKDWDEAIIDAVGLLGDQCSRAATVVKNWDEGLNADVKTERSRRERDNDLSARGPDPDLDRVDAVIQETAWTRYYCDECGCDAEMVIELGEEPYYESATARICHTCLLAALALFHTQTQTQEKKMTPAKE